MNKIREYHRGSNQCGQQADVWSLGCLLFEIIANDYMWGLSATLSNQFITVCIRQHLWLLWPYLTYILSTMRRARGQFISFLSTFFALCTLTIGWGISNQSFCPHRCQKCVTFILFSSFLPYIQLYAYRRREKFATYFSWFISHILSIVLDSILCCMMPIGLDFFCGRSLLL